VYFSREPQSNEVGGRLNFLKFETDKIDTCIEFMRHLQAEHQQLNGSQSSDLCVMATGGGAFKYYDKIKEALEVEVLREDEMECLIIGRLQSYVCYAKYSLTDVRSQVLISLSPKSPPKSSLTAKRTLRTLFKRD
jgi:pantothenate kinase